MFAQNMIIGLNALFLAPAALLGLISSVMLVKLFSSLLDASGRVHHSR